MSCLRITCGGISSLGSTPLGSVVKSTKNKLGLIKKKTYTVPIASSKTKNTMKATEYLMGRAVQCRISQTSKPFRNIGNTQTLMIFVYIAVWSYASYKEMANCSSMLSVFLEETEED